MVPTTSLHTNESHITDGVLVSQLARYGEIDDVWTTAFLQGLAISYSGSHAAHLDDSVLEWMSAHGIPRLYLLGSNIESVADDRITTFKGGLPPGPYLFVTSDSILSAHEVYRLHRDTYEAFLFGAIFDPVHDTFVPVEIDPPFNADQYIPLPSRLYSLLDTRPLAGKRFALKDIFDAKGLQTACGSHSYARIYPPATANSPAVQRLLDLGAVMVGKTKTSQFAHGANPWEFIDNKYPWNPRGDGYLTAASSSSGSACAIAGYDWIDFAVGSDTRGSVRKPASIVGSYGIRPTWGSMDLTGVMPMAEEMDTAGFFARDPLLFHQISSLW
jgi:hypothetical protein